MLLSNLQTETRNDLSSNIDIVPTLEMCKIMNAEDSRIAGAVESCLEEIASVIDLIADRVRENGRVIYFGAGTSGRLGVLDASEIPPTFSAPYSQFVGMMAGGDSAIRKAVEGAEDSMDGAIQDFQLLDPPLSPSDAVIGIASSGRTPYVLGGLSYAHDQGVLSVGICCVRPSEMRGRCGHVIESVVGPEIVTGSTRMKAGTATKLVLNMISTGVMIRIGKTYGNLMVDVKPSNFKLVDRARRIFRAVLPDTTLSDAEIDSLIESCQHNVKQAIVVERHKCSTSEAEHILNKAGGVLKHALQLPEHVTSHQSTPTIPIPPSGRLVLCVDAGGTTCKVVIADKNGILSRGEAGPCNFVTLGHDTALASLSKAVIAALSQVVGFASLASTLPPSGSIFAGAWIGGAGLDRSAELASVRLRIASLLNLSDPQTLLVTNDAALLSSAIIPPPNPTEYAATSGIVLISGTGAIAHSYRLSNNNHSLPKPVNRANGWGYLLGDEGSAFAIGRDAIRAALNQRDCGLPATLLHLTLTKHFACGSIEDLIPAVYSKAPIKDENSLPVGSDPKLRVAGICRIVFNLAFPSSHNILPDKEALDIVQRHASYAADMVTQLLARDRDVQAFQSVLVFGGALGQVEGYRNMIVEILRSRGHHFSRIEHVSAAAEVGIRVLMRDYLTSDSV